MFDNDPFNGVGFNSTDQSEDTPDRDEEGGLLHEAILQLPGMDERQGTNHLQEVLEIELNRMEDGPEKQKLQQQFDEVCENNVTHEPKFCENDENPAQTDSGVQLYPSYPANRVLSMQQRADLRSAIREVASMSPGTQPIKEGVIGVENVGVVHVAYNHASLTITVETPHKDDVGALTTATVINCDDHPTGHRHSDDLSALGEMGEEAANLEADLLETSLLMLDGKDEDIPKPHEISSDSTVPVGVPYILPYGRSFDSMQCNGRRTSFQLTVSMRGDIKRIYTEGYTSTAEDIGIPLEPTIEEREA